MHRLRESCVKQLEHSSNTDSIHIDGRKILVAYRRLLYYLCYIKMKYKEDMGETDSPYRLQLIEKELTGKY